MNPLINILIRTSNRPKGFARLLKSIEGQSYKNINIIVSFDTIEKPGYIPEDLQFVNVVSLKWQYWQTDEAFYNLYCNWLMQEVEEGYFIFIDDDDIIRHPRALDAIVRRLNPNKANIIQMTRKGRKKPQKDEIVSGKIGMPCIILHSKHKGLAKFDGSYNADYKFIKEVSGKIGHKFIEVALVEAGERGNGKC